MLQVLVTEHPKTNNDLITSWNKVPGLMQYGSTIIKEFSIHPLSTPEHRPLFMDSSSHGSKMIASGTVITYLHKGIQVRTERGGKYSAKTSSQISYW